MKALLGGISIVLLISCLKSKPNYNYTKGISEYMYAIHKIQIDTITNKVLYFLPISECVSCSSTELNLKMLTELKTENLTPILIGVKTNSRFNTLSSSLKNISLLDKESKIYMYETGVLKPLLLHIKNGKVIHFFNVDDNKIEEARKYLIQYEF